MFIRDTAEDGALLAQSLAMVSVQGWDRRLHQVLRGPLLIAAGSSSFATQEAGMHCHAPQASSQAKASENAPRLQQVAAGGCRVGSFAFKWHTEPTLQHAGHPYTRC